MTARLSNYAIVLMSYTEEDKQDFLGTLNRRLNSIFQCHINSYNFCTFPTFAIIVCDYISVCHSTSRDTTVNKTKSLVSCSFLFGGGI